MEMAGPLWLFVLPGCASCVHRQVHDPTNVILRQEERVTNAQGNTRRVGSTDPQHGVFDLE